MNYNPAGIAFSCTCIDTADYSNLGKDGDFAFGVPVFSMEAIGDKIKGASPFLKQFYSKITSEADRKLCTEKAVLECVLNMGIAIHAMEKAKSYDPVAIRDGMSAQQVKALLGAADERRIPLPQGPRLVGEAYRWAYGVKAPGTFAARGLVVFNELDTVVATLSPVSGRREQVSSGDAGVGPSEMACELGGVHPEKDGRFVGTVTLVNRGSGAFDVRQSGCPEWSQLAISTFAEDGTLLCRLDLVTLCSPYAPGELPPWRFEPGQRRARAVDWSQCWSEFGPLPAGRYLAQASFPFGDAEKQSGRMAFEVAPAPAVPPTR